MNPVLQAGVIERNPAWVQLLGLCPLLAVSSSVVNALALALASAFVMCGANSLIALLRRGIPTYARLPCFVLIIASFTTIVTLLLEAYAFEVYLKIALFVQIIVTNCMILGRAEQFASRQPVHLAFLDALGTSAGFALALLTLGAAREVIGQGTLLANFEQLFGASAAGWEISVLPAELNLQVATMAPGAFIIAALLLAGAQAVRNRRGDGIHTDVEKGA